MRVRDQAQLSGLSACFLALGLIFSTGCHRASTVSTPLSQRGYLWQRAWNPAVAEALNQADGRMDGVVILGAEILWRGKYPESVQATIDWEFLKNLKKPVAIALRVAPYPGPFSATDNAGLHLIQQASSLLAEAQNHGIKLSEFQLDFDCAQKKLDGYGVWLDALRPVIRPTHFVITTLPSWLDEPGFEVLIKHVDGYVLQVHSVPTDAQIGHAALCDPSLARKWINAAARFGRPFAAALPTYRCLAGYDQSGKLLSVAMDSVKSPWPPGTRILDFSTNSDEVASLVKELQTAHPPELNELLWYRIPVATDQLNWRWPTLVAVMEGRPPLHRLAVVQEGSNPVDLSISNTGEADKQGAVTVTVTWDRGTLVAWDALPDWKVKTESGRAVFIQDLATRSQLPPGQQHSIGWLRYDQVTTVRSDAEERPQDDR